MPEPLISVIVPTRDRHESLAGCLRALAAQTLEPDRFEIIVCDDGSEPPVEVTGYRTPVRVTRQSPAGPAAARNLGATLARGRYLAFTDDDCEPEPDWLERLAAHYEALNDVLIGGGMRNGAQGAPAAATQAIMDFVYADHWRRAGARLFSTSNLSMPTAGFHELGGFSPSFPDAAGEDYDLCWRWQESGRRAMYAPDVVIVHRHELTVGAFLGQHYRYGRGLMRVRRRRASRGGRSWSPGISFYVRLVVHPLRRWRDPSAWRSASLIAASQFATAMGALAEWLSSGGSRRAGEPEPA